MIIYKKTIQLFCLENSIFNDTKKERKLFNVNGNGSNLS